MISWNQHLRLGNVVQAVEQLVDRISTVDPFERAEIVHAITGIMHSERGRRVPGGTRELIRRAFGDEWLEREGAFRPFAEHRGAVGKAFGGFQVSVGGEETGLVGRFYVCDWGSRLDETSDVDTTAKPFTDAFEQAKLACVEVLRELDRKCTNTKDLFSRFGLSLQIPHGEPSSTWVYRGRSGGLAIGVALFSTMFQLPCSPTFAFTGRLEGRSVLPVDGMGSKLSALLKELPEATTILVPEGCGRADDPRIRTVKTLTEALFLLWPDLKGRVSGTLLPGEIGFEWNRILIHANEFNVLQVKHDTTLDPAILTGLRPPDPPSWNTKGVIISGQSPQWVIAYLMSWLRPQVHVIAIHYPAGHCAVVVKSTDGAFYAGQRLPYSPV